MVVFWKETLWRQPQIITPEHEGWDSFSTCLHWWSWCSSWSLALWTSRTSWTAWTACPPPGWPPAPSPAGKREWVGPRKNSRERVPLRPSQSEPQLVPIPMSDDDDNQPPQEERLRWRSRSRERTYPHAQAPQVPQGQPMDTPETDEISDEEFLDMNHSSPLVEPQPSAEQRGRSRRDERSRSRERTPPRSSPQDLNESSATVDPQNRVSDRSRSHQEREDSRRSGPQQQRHDPSQQRGKKTVAERQSSESPKAKEAQVYWFRWRRWRASKWTCNFFKHPTYWTSTSFIFWWWRQWTQRGM